jgi:SAM-dependent methyltransferase
MLSKEEKQELIETPPAWMYEFDLGEGIKTPLLTEELRSIHATREEMLVTEIDRCYPKGLHELDCLDVACNEGYFSQLLYRRGARVKGIDIRPTNIKRAKLVQQNFGLSPERLTFELGDFLELKDPDESYEIVLFLGLLYHLENPMQALRNLFRLTRRLCVLETQLTRQNTPMVSGWGQSGSFMELPACLALYQEPDPETNNLASYHTLSFIPNAAAVRLMLSAAGFQEVVQAVPQPGMNQQYLLKDRAVFFAWK